MPFEELHRALVLLGGRKSGKGSQISTLAGLRVDFSGVKPVFARGQFANHFSFPPSPRLKKYVFLFSEMSQLPCPDSSKPMPRHGS